MNFITYDDYIPNVSPTKYDTSMKSIKGDDTFESESGHTNTNTVRQVVYSLDISYTNITNTDLEEILTRINKEKVDVSFYFGTMINGEFEASSIKPTFKFYQSDVYGGVEVSYWDLSFSLNEL